MEDLEKLYWKDEEKYFEICDAELKNSVITNISKVYDMLLQMKKCELEVKKLLDLERSIKSIILEDACKNLGIDNMSLDQGDAYYDFIEQILPDDIDYIIAFSACCDDFIENLRS